MTRFTVFLIAVFYVLAVSCGIILLAAVQFRSSTGAVFDTWLLKQDANRALNREILEQLQPAKKELASVLDSVNFTEQCLKLFDNDGALTPAASRFQAEADKARASGRSNDPNLRTEVACVLRGYASLEYDKPYYDRQKKDFSAKIAELEDSRVANEKEFAELVGQNPDFVALRQLRKKWQTALFVDVPYDFLILLLVMMMGALGGMVRTIRLYGDPEHMDPKPKDYFLFPLIGMVVAIGGFVLAKTGLLLLSTNGGEAALSPFMIGLVGIISGLLAKEVIDSIADKGRKVLAGEKLPAGSRRKSPRKSAAAPKGRSRAAPAKQPAKKAGKAAQPKKGRGSA